MFVSLTRFQALEYADNFHLQYSMSSQSHLSCGSALWTDRREWWAIIGVGYTHRVKKSEWTAKCIESARFIPAT